MTPARPFLCASGRDLHGFRAGGHSPGMTERAGTLAYLLFMGAVAAGGACSSASSSPGMGAGGTPGVVGTGGVSMAATGGAGPGSGGATGGTEAVANAAACGDGAA